MKLRTKSARFDSSTNCAALQRRQRVVCWNQTAGPLFKRGKIDLHKNVQEIIQSK